MTFLFGVNGGRVGRFGDEVESVQGLRNFIMARQRTRLARRRTALLVLLVLACALIALVAAPARAAEDVAAEVQPDMDDTAVAAGGPNRAIACYSISSQRRTRRGGVRGRAGRGIAGRRGPR